MGYLSTLPDGAHRQGQPHVLRVDRAGRRRAARHAVPGPADRRRPGLPRDPPGAAAADAGRGAGDRARRRPASTARCCRACSTPSSCATTTARRCWCGRRCSRRRRGGATSASCWPRSGRPRSRRRGRGSCSRWCPTSRRRRRCEDVAAVIVERGRAAMRRARCARWCWSRTPSRRTRTPCPAAAPVRSEGLPRGAAGGAAARRPAGSSPWSWREGVRTVPLDDRLRASAAGGGRGDGRRRADGAGDRAGDRRQPPARRCWCWAPGHRGPGT